MSARAVALHLCKDYVSHSYTWQDIIDSFIEKYNIQEESVRSAILRAIEFYFKIKHKTDIATYIENNEIIIFKYGKHAKHSSIANQYQLKLRDLNEKAVKFIKQKICQNINLEYTCEYYNNIKQISRTLVYGAIVNISNMDYIKINIPVNDIKHDIAYFLKEDQIPIERSKYTVGKTFDFYVKKVTIEKDGLKYKTKIYLSRTSIRLPELIAAEYKYKVLCKERKPGKYCRIKSYSFIHPNIKKEIEDRLNEKIFFR